MCDGWSHSGQLGVSVSIRSRFPQPCLRCDGCLPRNFPPGAGDGHALAGAHADEICFELGEGGEDIEEHLAHGIAQVVERPPEGQFHGSFLEQVGDGAGIWDGPGEAVQSGHNQGVALAHGGQGLVEAGSGAGGAGEAVVGAGEAVVGVDAIWGDAQLEEGLMLDVQILAVGGTARISYECFHHGGSVRIGSRLCNCHRTFHMRHSSLRFGGGGSDRVARPLDDPLTDTAAPAGMNG